MRLLDRSRLIYSLAGALLESEWSDRALKTSLRRFCTTARIKIPGLAARMLQSFATKPDYYTLVALLRAEAKWKRAKHTAARTRSKSRISLRRPTMGERPLRLAEIAVPNLPTETALAKWFGVSTRVLRWRADPAGRNRRHPRGPLRTYRHQWIPRRSGQPRLLEIPTGPLKQMQRKVLAEILNAVPIHPAAHGFTQGRSIVTNAAVHCAKKTVLRFDLADFFPSVSSARVFVIFRTIGYPAEVARLLTGLSTTQMPASVWEDRPGARDGADYLARERLITRHLPQGAPTSPALANLAAARLDRRLSGLAKAADASYTRYADDLTFSGGPQLARSRKRFESHVALIAIEEGFALNHRKTRIMRAGVRQRVTGVIVNVRPNVDRREFDRLKAILTNCLRHGPASQNREEHADFRAYLAGTIAHVASIHPGRGEKLRQLFTQISW